MPVLKAHDVLPEDALLSRRRPAAAPSAPHTQATPDLIEGKGWLGMRQGGSGGSHTHTIAQGK